MDTKHFALICAALLTAGCAHTLPAPLTSPPSAFDSRAVRSLRWLDSADPERDLGAAWARGDRRFVGVYGYAAITPGVEHALALRQSTRYLAGTSDAIEGREHLRLCRLATRYAERYNQFLLQRLSRRGSPSA